MLVAHERERENGAQDEYDQGVFQAVHRTIRRLAVARAVRLKVDQASRDRVAHGSGADRLGRRHSARHPAPAIVSARSDSVSSSTISSSRAKTDRDEAAARSG